MVAPCPRCRAAPHENRRASVIPRLGASGIVNRSAKQLSCPHPLGSAPAPSRQGLALSDPEASGSGGESGAWRRVGTGYASARASIWCRVYLGARVRPARARPVHACTCGRGSGGLWGLACGTLREAKRTTDAAPGRRRSGRRGRVDTMQTGEQTSASSGPAAAAPGAGAGVSPHGCPPPAAAAGQAAAGAPPTAPVWGRQTTCR